MLEESFGIPARVSAEAVGKVLGMTVDGMGIPASLLVPADRPGPPRSPGHPGRALHRRGLRGPPPRTVFGIGSPEGKGVCPETCRSAARQWGEDGRKRKRRKRRDQVFAERDLVFASPPTRGRLRRPGPSLFVKTWSPSLI
ncbi:MAG: hypothetical protein MZV63_65210 [Marinilabiliales bacterium]|nr:hypothetical protein [Marinilabiliales bacterium]